MVNFRDQAKFDRTGWRLMVLLPCWVAQISLLLILLGTSCYLFVNAIKESVEVRGTAIAWEGINIVISSISILCTAYEIMRTVQRALTPTMMLVTNLIKLVGVILSMIMDGMVLGTTLTVWSDGTLVIHSFLIITILVSGSYAAWNWKRLTQYDSYHNPGNAQGFGYGGDLKKHHKGLSSHSRMLSDDMDWDADLELGNNVEIVHSSTPAAVMAPSPTRTSHDITSTTRPASTSFTKVSGRLNYSMTQDTAYNPVSTTADASETITVPKRPASYNHTRDTAFDEYVRQQKSSRRTSQRMSMNSSTSSSSNSRRGSIASPPTSPPSSRVPSGQSAALYRLSLNLKNEVDDALSAGFWDAASASSGSRMSIDTARSTPPVEVSGTVAGVKSVRDSLGRAPSDGSEKGALGSVPEDEDAEEETEERRQRNVDEASRALLGGSAREDHEHPELLRPGRPKSEAIELVVTPASPLNPRMTWGSSYSRN